MAFIQARLSSSRFPGKVLAPLCGIPVIQHLLETVSSVDGITSAIVLTSTEASDDRLVQYLESNHWPVFRGPLLDVFQRFQTCASQFDVDWILRLCADSPLLRPQVIRQILDQSQTTDCDVITTRFSPPFPKGQNAELIRRSTLLSVVPDDLNESDREHVTPWFYRNPERYRIVNARQVDFDLPGNEFTVDTRDDLQRLEKVVAASRVANRP